MLLIVSEQIEPNVDAVEAILRERGVAYVRFNTEEFPLAASLTVGSPTSGTTGLLKSAGGEVDLSRVRTVWYRRVGPHRLTPGLSVSEERAVRTECDLTLNSLWSILDCFWVNDPFRQRYAQHKLVQLKVAQRVGFEIPKTLVTNNPDEVLTFYRECKRQVVFKTFGQSVLKDEEPSDSGQKPAKVGMIYTNLLRERDFDKLHTIRACPVLFQEYVPKHVELRVTIVGREIFAAEIHSQQAPQEATRLDWRHYDLEHTPHRPHDLPPQVAQKLLAFMEAFGLAFGCLDLILTPDGRYVFLENNPAGQFGWIEGLVGFPITKSLAEMLIRGRMEP